MTLPAQALRRSGTRKPWTPRDSSGTGNRLSEDDPSATEEGALRKPGLPRDDRSPSWGPLTRCQGTLHEGFRKASSVCLKGRLKWDYSEALLSLSEAPLWPHSGCGQSSPAFRPVPGASLCPQRTALLDLRPFLNLLMVSSFMTQEHPKPSGTPTLSGSPPGGRLGHSGCGWFKEETPRPAIISFYLLAPPKGRGWRNHGDSHYTLQTDSLWLRP